MVTDASSAHRCALPTILFCLTLHPGCAQPALSPDVQLLASIRTKAARNLGRLPDYTCRQTTERSIRRIPGKKFELTDTVRLEVALVGGKELYGWPGANNITEWEVSNLVSGTFGNGDFGLHAAGVLLSDGATFTRAPDELLDGRRVIRYNYRVALLSSGYVLKVAPREAVVPYHGSIWVDSDTFDLLRLDVIADDVPAILGIKTCSKTLEYRRTPIGGAPFLLPFRSGLIVLDLNGAESRNRTVFHECRQYTGESVLTFADPLPESTPPTPAAPPELSLPDEFVADVELLTPIDFVTSAVGDPIEARLLGNIKEHRTLIVPKGATLNGRIARLERAGSLFTFDFIFDSLQSLNGRATLAQRDNQLSLVLPASRCLPTAFSICSPVTPSIPASRALQMHASRLKLERGFRMRLHSRLLKSEMK